MIINDRDPIISSSFDATVVNFAQTQILPRGEVRGRLSGHPSKAVRCLDGAPQSRPSVMGMIINRAKCVTGSAGPVTSERWRITRCTDLSTVCEEGDAFHSRTGTVFFNIYAFVTVSNSTFPFIRGL